MILILSINVKCTLLVKCDIFAPGGATKIEIQWALLFDIGFLLSFFSGYNVLGILIDLLLNYRHENFFVGLTSY